MTYAIVLRLFVTKRRRGTVYCRSGKFHAYLRVRQFICMKISRILNFRMQNFFTNLPIFQDIPDFFTYTDNTPFSFILFQKVSNWDYFFTTLQELSYLKYSPKVSNPYKSIRLKYLECPDICKIHECFLHANVCGLTVLHSCKMAATNMYTKQLPWQLLLTLYCWQFYIQNCGPKLHICNS